MKISSIKTNSYPQTKILFPQTKTTMPKMNSLNFGDIIEFHKPDESEIHSNKIMDKVLNIFKTPEDPFRKELIDEYVRGEVEYIDDLTEDIYSRQEKNYPEAKRFLRSGKKSRYTTPIQLGIFKDKELLEFSDMDSVKKPKTGTMRVSDKDNNVLVEYELYDGLNSYTVNDFTGYPTIRTTEMEGKIPTYYKSTNTETGRQMEIEFLSDDIYIFKEKSPNSTNKLTDYTRILYNDLQDTDNSQYIEYNEEMGLFQIYMINPETQMWELEYESDDAPILSYTINL